MKTFNFEPDEIVYIKLKGGKITKGRVVGFTKEFIKVWKRKSNAYILDEEGNPKIFFEKPLNVLKLNDIKHPLSVVGKKVF